MLSASYASRFTFHVSRLAAHRWLVLAALGGASLLVYWLGLILPYNLFALQLKPLLNIAKLTRDRPAAQAGFVLTFAVLSGLYYLAWRMCRGHQPRAMWLALLAGLVAVNLSMLWLYPIGAADIFDNIVRGRITARHGGNPFYEPPKVYARDALYAYAAWSQSTSAYGPLWELLAAGTSRIAGDDRLANVLGFKALGLIFYGGCIALIASLLNRHAPERALQGVCLFAWNPLVIYETAGNGHNDIVMVFFILLGLAALLRGRFTWSALALVTGALIKFIPILLLPVALVTGLRLLPAWRARLAFLFSTGLACAALVIAAYAPFWRGGDLLDWQRRAGLYTTSLPAVIQAQLEGLLGGGVSERIVSRAALLLTSVAVLAQTWRVWSKVNPHPNPPPFAKDANRGGNPHPNPPPFAKSANRGGDSLFLSSALPQGGGAGDGGWLVPVRASAFILLFYLLFTCLWFQSWYTLWPLALAAILPEGATARTAVLLSYAALWKTIIFDFFLYRGGPLPPRVWRETVLGPATLGLTWLYVGYATLRAHYAQRSPRRR